MIVKNSDIGYSCFPPDELVTEECLIQYIFDNPDEIYRFANQIVNLKEGNFVVAITDWMDLELVPIKEDRNDVSSVNS